MTSFDVRFWQIETRKCRKPRVRWVVARNKFGESFTTKGLAEAFRAKLITWRLDSGVPDAQVAAWAGHSVEMLRRVYAGRAEGLDGIWITRMDRTLPWEQP